MKLKKDVDIYRSDFTKPANADWEKLATLRNVNYTLGQVLYAILWELSWHGGPEDRDKLNKELKGMVDRINSGEEKTIPMEEVLKDLKDENKNVKKNK